MPALSVRITVKESPTWAVVYELPRLLRLICTPAGTTTVPGTARGNAPSGAYDIVCVWWSLVTLRLTTRYWVMFPPVAFASTGAKFQPVGDSFVAELIWISRVFEDDSIAVAPAVTMRPGLKPGAMIPPLTVPKLTPVKVKF